MATSQINEDPLGTFFLNKTHHVSEDEEAKKKLKPKLSLTYEISSAVTLWQQDHRKLVSALGLVPQNRRNQGSQRSLGPISPLMK